MPHINLDNTRNIALKEKSSRLKMKRLEIRAALRAIELFQHRVDQVTAPLVFQERNTQIEVQSAEMLQAVEVAT